MNGNSAAPQAQPQAQAKQQSQSHVAPNSMVAHLKKQLNDPHDAFFIGLAFRKERELHQSNEKCLDQLSKLTLIMNAKQKAKTDDPNWKLNIYSEYSRSPLSATAYLSPHIANPSNSPVKPQQPAQQNQQQPNNAAQPNNKSNQNPSQQNKPQPSQEQNPKQQNQQQSSQQPNQNFWVSPYSNDNSPQKDQQKPNQQNNSQPQGSVPPQNSANKPNDPSGQPNKNPQSQQQSPQQQQQQQQQQPSSGKQQPVSANQQPQQGNQQSNPNGNQQQQQPQKQNNDPNPQQQAQKGSQPAPNSQQPVGNGAAQGQQQPQNGGSQSHPQQNQQQGQNPQPQQQQQQQNQASKDTNPNSANKQTNNNDSNSGNKSDDDICGICTNKVHASERITLKCDHDFHLNCLKKVVGKMLERGIYPIRCQAQKLCPYIITIPELTQIMPEESNKKLLQQCSSSYESNYGRIVQCPREKCGKRFLCSTPKESNVACAFCSEEICLVCMKARHYGLECDQMNRFKPHEFDQIVAENKKRLNQKCPNCSKTHKNDDCMECVKCQCGTRFCTICHSELAICQCHWYKALKSGTGQYDSNGRSTEPQSVRSRASTPSKNIPTGTSSQNNIMNDSASNHGDQQDHQLNPIQGNQNRQAQLWSNSRGDQGIGGTPRSSLGSKYQLAKKQIHASQQQQLQLQESQQQQPTQDSQYPDSGASPMRNSYSKDRPASRSRGMAVPLFPDRGMQQQQQQKQQNDQYQKQIQNDPYISSDYRQNVLPKLQNRRINNNEVFQQDTYDQYLQQQQKAQRLQQAAQDPNVSNYNTPLRSAGGGGNQDNPSNGGSSSMSKKSIFDDEERRSKNPTPSRVNDARRFTPSQSQITGQRDD